MITTTKTNDERNRNRSNLQTENEEQNKGDEMKFFLLRRIEPEQSDQMFENRHLK